MAALDFPASPIDGDIYNVGSLYWRWDATGGSWLSIAIPPFRFYGSLAGKPTAGQELFDIEMVGDEVFDEDLPDNLGSCDIAPTGPITMNIKNAGSIVGSAQIAAGATVMTWTLAGGLSPAAGDNLSFIAPGSVDATMSGLSYTFVGKKIS